MTHIVWDWNGTLLNDFHAVVDAANGEITRLGGVALPMQEYRARFTRPVRSFNEAVLGRSLSDEEWAELDDRFHDTYFASLDRCQLADGVLDALDRAAAAGCTQSLLSMAPHDHLLAVVERFGLTGRFVRIDGNTGPSGAPKERSLRAHLNRLDLDRDACVYVIGDSVDDAVAAKAVGAKPLLVESGSCHTLEVLVQFAPVVPDVTAAVRVIVEAQQGHFARG